MLITFNNKKKTQLFLYFLSKRLETSIRIIVLYKVLNILINIKLLISLIN